MYGIIENLLPYKPKNVKTKQENLTQYTWPQKVFSIGLHIKRYAALI